VDRKNKLSVGDQWASCLETLEDKLLTTTQIPYWEVDDMVTRYKVRTKEDGMEVGDLPHIRSVPMVHARDYDDLLRRCNRLEEDLEDAVDREAEHLALIDEQERKLSDIRSRLFAAYLVVKVPDEEAEKPPEEVKKPPEVPYDFPCAVHGGVDKRLCSGWDRLNFARARYGAPE
jgi:hypothetical protein